MRNKSLINRFNGYVNRTTNSEELLTKDVHAQDGTHVFANQIESARANYSTIANTSQEDCERIAQMLVHDAQVNEHLKYLFANISTKDEDEIYPVTVSEIAATQQRHELYKMYFTSKPSAERIR